MSSRAWKGDQIEHYSYDDSPFAFEQYSSRFDSFFTMCQPLPFDVITVKHTDDPLKANAYIKKVKEVKEVMVFQHMRNDVEPDLVKFAIDCEKIKGKYELNFFIKNNILLLIYDFPTTYKNGISPEINRAVLQTIHTFASNEKISLLALDKNYSVGRNKLVFPKNWATLYEQWKNKEITSKEFIGSSGLKKATFYNMLSEYEALLQEQIEYEKLA